MTGRDIVEGRYSAEEIAALSDMFRSEPFEDIMAALPGRSWPSIRAASRLLGLERDAGAYRLGERRRQTPDGYVRVRAGRTWRSEHVCVWEAANDTRLPEGCVVHHKDGVPWHNRPENLDMMTNIEHLELHTRLRHADSDPDLDYFKWKSQAMHAEPRRAALDLERFRELYLSGMAPGAIRAEMGLTTWLYNRSLREAFGEWRRPRRKKEREPELPGGKMLYDAFMASMPLLEDLIREYAAASRMGSDPEI